MNLVTMQKQNREDLVTRTMDLSRKIRELSFLSRVADAIDRRGRPFSEVVEAVLSIIPGMTGHPETVCARIVLDGVEHRTAVFQETRWFLASDIVARCGVAGSLEVFSLEQPETGPSFTEGEKKLIDNIAARLGRVVARKRSEEMLVESEGRYRGLFEDSRDAICTVSAEGVILDANRSALDLFGYEGREMLGMHVDLMYAAPADLARFEGEITSSGSVRNFEARLRRKDGAVLDCLCTASRLRPGPGGLAAGYHAIIRDITREKASEVEKLALIRELKGALESIGTLKGLIPICASCKKIRDDKGYWNRLEEYLEAQTGAVFSHGLCPGCQKRFEEE
jgi:PAS domain S-box-containing protein